MDVLKNRTIFLIISAILFTISLLLILIPKLNLWIDMTWWIQIDYNYSSLEINDLKEKLYTAKDDFIKTNPNSINDLSVYNITWKKSLSIVVWFNNIDDVEKLDNYKIMFRSNIKSIITEIDPLASESKYINIWKSFWDYIKNTAFITLIIALCAITFYVSFAFSGIVSGINVFSFAMITLITLFHDVIISTWFYILVSLNFLEFQIDTFFITALLTILGYSINDTIVIFDRIRSNLKKYAWIKWKNQKNLYDIINLSVNQALRRSIYTSLTLFFVLLTIFFFWPESISWFILVMIFGTLIWTYSSIFIASPILYIVNKNTILKKYTENTDNQDHKIVV
jgi:preprotein translocase SecF subunit